MTRNANSDTPQAPKAPKATTTKRVQHTPAPKKKPLKPIGQAKVSDTKEAAAPSLHMRSRHHGHYDFDKLIAACPSLKKYVINNRYGNRSIDFANPLSVKTLNQALLALHYDILKWNIPDGYLCPPIPGRADYLHHVADLLATSNGGRIPRGEMVSVLDIGVGASAIYPLVGHREYKWRFVGTECDAKAIKSARKIIDDNANLSEFIILRSQRSAEVIFAGVTKPDEHFDVSICNPPFHTSADEAEAGTQRKWHQLGKAEAARDRNKAVRNFGGQDSELWCDGGEVGFISRMITESLAQPGLCLWYTSLVAKANSVPPLVRALQAAHVREKRIIEMAQGQKQSRILAWTFLDERQRRDWKNARWPQHK